MSPNMRDLEGHRLPSAGLLLAIRNMTLQLTSSAMLAYPDGFGHRYGRRRLSVSCPAFRYRKGGRPGRGGVGPTVPCHLAYRL